jgi:ribosomal protein S18 acetylase RimI-like enzyme
MEIRHLVPADYAAIIPVVDDWWGGRVMRDMLPKLFFTHFRETSFVAEHEGAIAGFLVGFLSQTYRDEAYIHFVGVHPALRGQQVGRRLYEHFFQAVLRHRRHVVRCVTSPINTGSIAFHLRMGFQNESPDVNEEGVAIARDYDGMGGDRVLFVKRLHEQTTDH